MIKTKYCEANKLQNSTAGTVAYRNKEMKAQHLGMHEEKITSRNCSWKKQKSPTM